MKRQANTQLKLVTAAFRQVFRNWRYLVLSILCAASIGVGIIWLSNHQLIKSVFTSNLFDWSARLKILWTSLGLFATNFTLASQVMIIIVALLSGINIAMLVFHVRRRLAVQNTAGASMFGLIIGTLGVGCSACGSVILSSLIGITSASTLISVLPLGGVEFGLASIALIGLSVYLLAKKIQLPAVCALPLSPKATITSNQAKHAIRTIQSTDE